MKKPIFLTFILFFAASCAQKTPSAPLPAAKAYDYSHELRIAGQTLNVEIAKTPATTAQGLSGRDSMANDQGMLFDFGQSQSIAFWMKDMNFNLDFVWISNGKVVGITPDVLAPPTTTPDSELKLYYPPSPVDRVLELNAGWAEQNKIKTGDSVMEQD